MDTRDIFRRRINDTRDFLRDNHPEVFTEQKHLDAETEARAYWHFGYLMALDSVQQYLFPNGDGQ